MNTQIQFYKNFKQIKPSGVIRLKQFLKSIKEPKPELKELIDKIRQTKDKQIISNLKSKLPLFMIQSFGNGKTANDIDSFTGLTVLDFDGEDVKNNAKQFKQYLFDKYTSIIASFYSPSLGVKCIMKLEVAQSNEEYKDYYIAITDHFNNYIGFDSTPKNPVLGTYYTYDEDILVRDNATTWDIKLKEQPKPKNNQPPFISNKTNDGYLIEYQTQRAYNLIRGRFNNITTTGIGHPNVISASLCLGEWVRNYSLDTSEALEFICNQIENNLYLSKGVSGYIKTAIRYFNEGLSNPQKFPD